jgi:hypothetical protein
MRHLLLLLVFGIGCASSPESTYRRESGTVVPIAPCENGDTMCLDVLDTNLVLESGTVVHLELAALLRGPFDDGSAYVFHGASLVQPEHIDEANDSYGALTRYPLSVAFAPGEDVWHAGEVTHLVDAGTDGSSLAPLCGQTLFAEITLGAPSTSANYGYPMTSTTWLKHIDFTCR